MTEGIIRRQPNILLILGFVLILGWLIVCVRSVPFTGYETDGVFYMITSRLFFTEQFRPPTFGGGIGMPFAIWAMNRIVPDTFLAAKVVSLLAGTLFLVASTQVATGFFSKPVGWITGILIAVNPLVLIYSTVSLSDMLAAAWLMLAVWLILSDRHRANLLLAGICLGL